MRKTEKVSRALPKPQSRSEMFLNEIAQSINGVTIQGPQGEPGPKGPPGEPGVTPVKGVDYWTESDIQEIHAYIDQKIAEALAPK